LEIELPDPNNPLFLFFLIILINSFVGVIQIFFLFFLLIISGIISGSEVAYFSLNSNDINILKSQNKSSLKKILLLLKSPEKLLATILILNNLINVAIITLSAYFAWSIFGKNPLVFLTLTIIVTLMIVFFGEIIPKIYANNNKFFFIKISSQIIRYSFMFFKPFIFLLVYITKFFNPSQKKEFLESSTEDLNKAIDLTLSKETSKNEKNILEGIVNFGSIKVKEIMISRVDITTIEKHDSFNKISKLINTSGFSRIPVYKETIDNIEGILYVKDLIPYLNEKNFNWKTKIRPAFFIPENKKIDILFKDFQEKRVHLAIVIDEYGGVSGLITLEDVLEEIIGDIKDEFDNEEGFIYKKLDPHTFLFEGKTSLNDFCKLSSSSKSNFKKIKGESESLGGLLLEINNKIPSKGDKINFDNFVFTIMSVDKKRIRRVRVYKKSNSN
jgi:gliding motility-associated protein GldE